VKKRVLANIMRHGGKFQGNGAARTKRIMMVV
jgi:hypothetical protein